MILKQLYLGCLAQASYLIGDEMTKTATIVDPRRDVDSYVQEASALGLSIKHIILTHFHADFASGHLELQSKTGASIYFGAAADAEFPFQPLHDGDVIDMGDVKLQTMETPGHTMESISILVLDHDHDIHNPIAVLTGDCLFIGDVGRPDLASSPGTPATTLATKLYQSVQRLMQLPDSTILYPGHGAGSLCGKALASETYSTIGQQRITNPMVQKMSCEEFLSLVTRDQPEAPPYFSYDSSFNSHKHVTLDETVKRALKPLTADEMLQLQRGGAQVVDTREADAYQAGHVLGSTHIPLSGKYATYCGMVLDPTKPIVIVADPDHEQEAIIRLGRIGFDNAVGYVDGGIAHVSPKNIGTANSFTCRELGEKTEQNAKSLLLLDVRMPGEFKQGRLANSMLIPLHQLHKRYDEVPKDTCIAIYCRTGHRSSVAQSILEQHGIYNTANMEGGLEQWQAEGRTICTE